ncbi:methylcobalamin:coenzyme M methyltransferase [Limihaloglobus sulfuriphilus]|uniref:Methylcobalamin:coenzyme M methyltransferase n=1 Tax=Limihaloglobus sulfuriphilus TaxID=1851148 RepID=A0A1Q2MCG1_9BACT|nr:uroporphyrinogen decarboxylase family protein [Limihaloglobus sulfuriphilus]AQQ70339.1 methylcobalamin:coenzyme M methyltransferase [Limihaloglobus sulfuriphilus]
MTSKERVKITLQHKEADRVPINFAGANMDIDRRLKEHFGLSPDDNDGLLECLHVDFRVIEPPYTGKTIHENVPGRNIDPLWGIRTRWIENESGGYWDYCDFPLRDATLEQAKNWPMPDPDDFDYDSVLEQCRKYKDYFIVFGNPGYGDVINSTGMLRTMEQTLIDLITDDPVGLEIMNRKVTTQSEILRRVLETAGDKIDMLWIGEDLGTQKTPMVSLDVFRRHIIPLHMKNISIAKEYGLPVMIHSCGSSSWAFNDFIEMGIDVVDTLQPEAANMSPEYLKKTFGEKLCFNGCISTAGAMAYGTTDEAAQSVKDVLDVMMPGGGYIMAPTHSIQDNSPTENVVTVFETAYEYGKYGVG